MLLVSQCVTLSCLRAISILVSLLPGVASSINVLHANTPLGGSLDADVLFEGEQAAQSTEDGQSSKEGSYIFHSIHE